MTKRASPHASENVLAIEGSWRRLANQRRLYTVIGVLLVALALVTSLRFADDSNAGHFLDRLPHFFDFLSWLIPHDWNDVWRALLDLPSPSDTGSQEFNFPLGRVYITGDFYVPEYIYLMVMTINIALVATIVGFVGGLSLAFLAARNTMANGAIRWVVRRFMEILRAFPEIVIAGLFAISISLGPVAAIAAVGIHCIGAFGKLFYEVVENADMSADEGIRSTGGNWFERVRFAIMPQVMPNFTSYALLRLEINVRASTIIGAVGGGGIGEELKLSISRGFGAKTLALILLMMLTVFIIDRFSAWLRERLVGSQSFQQGA